MTDIGAGQLDDLEECFVSLNWRTFRNRNCVYSLLEFSASDADDEWLTVLIRTFMKMESIALRMLISENFKQMDG